MIGRLRGTLVATRAGAVIVDVGGVGYQVALTPRALAELPPLGEEVVLHTHLHVREDQLSLFGFPTEPERETFGLLLAASGVGPRLAMAILGTYTPTELRKVIVSGDTAALADVPGIGKRSAQKLVVELAARFDSEAEFQSGNQTLAEVRAALEALGFASGEIRDAMRNLPESARTEDLLQQALQELGRR